MPTPRALRSALIAAAILAAALVPTATAVPAQGHHLEGTGRPTPLLGSAFTILGAHSPDRALGNLARAGVKLIRQDFLWARIEPEPGRFDFSYEDRLVDQAARHGIGVLGILAYGNPIYSPAGGAMQPAGGGVPPFGVGASYLYPPDPQHLAEYTRFARRTAEHFAGRVRRWEVWNEENVGWRFWPPHEDPAAYAALLRAGATGLRQGDPHAVIATGGVFYPEVPPGLPEQGGLRYLNNVYDADPGIGAVVDAVAWHPYPYPFVAPEVVIPSNSSVPGSAEQIRRLLQDRHDAGERLWVTELGWPTHSEYGVTEARQAAYLARSFAELWAEGVGLITWYTYSDGPNAAHNQEDAFGLFRFDGSPKPSYFALKTLTTVLGDDVFAGSRGGDLGLEANEHAYEFDGHGERVTMLWTSPESMISDYGYLPSTDATRSVRIPVRGAVFLVSMTGKETRLAPDHGEVAVRISPFPVYLVEQA